VLRLDTPAGVWSRPEQFELLCSFAATLAEDLFAGDRLRGVILNGALLQETRRIRDIEAFLDKLARLQPVERPGVGGVPPPRGDSRATGEGIRPTVSFSKNLLTFAPSGARGVIAYVDGQPVASA
jgi:hypothetical protein